MNHVSGMWIITKMLKQYSYELIRAIGKKKHMNEFDITELLNEFWKVQYYTPDIVSSKLKEDAQKYF